MWKTQLAVYLGKEVEDGFFGFVALPSDSESRSNFFLVIDIKEGITKETGREILSLIKSNFEGQNISSLSGFDNFFNEEIKKHNLPTGLSLAAGFISENIFYLKTIGFGTVFIRRNDKLTKIIQGENSASGYIEKNDFFIFTTDRFINLFGENHLSRIFDHKTPNQIVESLAPEMQIDIDQGAIALFMQFFRKENEHIEENEQELVSKPQVIEKTQLYLSNFWQKFSRFRHEGGKKRTLTLVLTVLIVIVLIWSVGFGLIRRQQGMINKKITTSKELIVQKLDQADEVAFLNLSRAQVLIGEAKTELSSLKKEIGVKSYELGGKKSKEITQIENLIQEKENKIVKKEDKAFKEFYDLTLDNQKAKGIKFYLNNDILVILDKNQGLIYLLSLSKKSIEKIDDSNIKSADLVAGYQENVFFYVPEKGVYKISNNSKAKIIIDNDKEWGKIKDMTVYNGNIYLLDNTKNHIYKYIAGEEKYSSKSDYLKSDESISLEDATSMMIDSSLYLGFKDYTAKFNAGVRDVFKTNFPDENFNLNKVITSKDLEKVYSWDKNNGSLYVLGKNGTYERQVQSSIFNKGEDVVVYDNAAYILIREKIYEVNLD